MLYFNEIQKLFVFPGSIVTSETQSTSSASTDDCDDKKVDRDMALAK